MIALLTGSIVLLTPTKVILDVQGVGYELPISLHTYTALQGKKQVTLHTYLKVSEDAHTLYGFADPEEKEMFIRLIGVSGVGAATARMMLSSLKPAELGTAILAGNVRQLESIKGIGKKTAERLVLELKDKIGKSASGIPVSGGGVSNMWADALDALLALGIQRSMAEQALKKVQTQQPDVEQVETIIKQALKNI